MSLLWRKHLRISLSGDSLVLAAYERGLRPGKPRSSVAPVQGNPNDPEWRAAVDALPETLAAFRDHEVSVVSPTSSCATRSSHGTRRSRAKSSGSRSRGTGSARCTARRPPTGT